MYSTGGLINPESWGGSQAKVFRTYNASIVLDEELAKMPASVKTEAEKRVYYTQARASRLSPRGELEFSP